MLDSLIALKDTHIIFTFTNSDTNGRIINSMIKKFGNWDEIRQKMSLTAKERL